MRLLSLWRYHLYAWRFFSEPEPLVKIDMIYLDVTSSCRSIRNAGTQRMTRRIFAELTTRVSVTPICWNRLGNFYHLLGASELNCLTAPFRDRRRPQSRPELLGENFPGELRRMLARKKIDVLSEL